MTQLPTALVIEDDADSAAVLQDCLRGLGYDVLTTDRAESAVTYIVRHIPSVVLCDIELAGRMTGYDLARAARKLPGGDDMLLLAMTGHTGTEHREAAREAGFDRTLHKPFDLSALRDNLP